MPYISRSPAGSNYKVEAKARSRKQEAGSGKHNSRLPQPREYLFLLHASCSLLRMGGLCLPFQDNIAAAVRVLHQKEQSIAVVGCGDLLF